MPRKKEFDVDAVLHKAMTAFWTRGYEATSLNDLLDCMQIQRASLYNAFGDKRTLFLETLRRYDVIYRRAEVAKRVNMPSPRQAILGLFHECHHRGGGVWGTQWVFSDQYGLGVIAARRGGG